MKLLVAALLLIAGSAQAEMKDLGTVSELVAYSDNKMGRSIADHYREFKSRVRHFGAFSYNHKAQVSAYRRNMTSLSAAIELSMQVCKELAEGEGTCILYATMIPKGYPKSTFDLVGLNQGLSEQKLKGEYAKEAANGGGFSALATTISGSWGYTTGKPTRAEALETALEKCQSYSAADMAKESGPTRKLLRKLRADQCQVVDVRKD